MEHRKAPRTEAPAITAIGAISKSFTTREPNVIPVNISLPTLKPGIRDSSKSIELNTSKEPTKNNVRKFTLTVKNVNNGFAIIIANERTTNVANTYIKLIGNTIPANIDTTK